MTPKELIFLADGGPIWLADALGSKPASPSDLPSILVISGLVLGALLMIFLLCRIFLWWRQSPRWHLGPLLTLEAEITEKGFKEFTDERRSSCPSDFQPHKIFIYSSELGVHVFHSFQLFDLVKVGDKIKVNCRREYRLKDTCCEPEGMTIESIEFQGKTYVAD